MAGDAENTVRKFWEIQNDGDYTRLVELFAKDAVLEDPMFGTFRGREAIADFMARMNKEMGGRGIHFTLVELAGDDHTSWAQWIAHTPEGEREGVGIYRVKDGEMTYYRDYMHPPKTG